LGNFTKIIVKNAEAFGKTGRDFPDKFLPHTPIRAQLRSEILLAKYSFNNLVKTRAYTNAARLHRKIAAKKRANNIEERAVQGLPAIRPKKAVNVPRLRNADGVLVCDDVQKKNIITEFYATLWEDKDKLHGEIPEWVYARWNSEVLDVFPLLDGSMLLNMALKFGKGKMSANDRVAIEMVIALDELVLSELAQCFRLRALNHESEDADDVWDAYGVTLILKKLAPTSPSDLRPIAILPCLSKLFFATWTFLISPTVTPNFKVPICFSGKTSGCRMRFYTENAYREIY
jgi:hypothetical protein